LCRLEPHMWMLPCVDKDWHVLCGGVDVIVVGHLALHCPFVWFSGFVAGLTGLPAVIWCASLTA